MISNYVWQYSYSSNHGAWDSGNQASTDLSYSAIDKNNIYRSIPSTANTKHNKTTTVIAPDNSKTVYFYNRDYTSFKEGSLVAIDKYDTDSRLMVRTEMTLTKGQRIGLTGMKNDNHQPLHYRINETQSKRYVYDSGVQTYTTIYSGFDIYGYSAIAAESNNFNGKTRYTKQTYLNDTINWLIGLPQKTYVSATSTFSSSPTTETIYHSATGSYKSLPYEQRSFGRWYKRNTSYHTSGSSKGLPNKVTYNGTNRWKYYSNYKRGIAQTIRTPQSLSTASQYTYKVVDNNGWVIEQRDFLNKCVNYGYDSLGRLTLVDPCDNYWLSTTISYATTSSSEGLTGVSSGMTKQTVTKGNYQKITYYDGLLRPVMSKEWDKSLSSTARFSRYTYDAFSRPKYQSLVSASSARPYGVNTTYDGLGRPKTADNNTTSGMINYRYLSNNRVQISDNKNNITTTTYLAYGAPAQSMATYIASPESVTTAINYNIYGNITSVTQGGQTEYRAYDSYQQLCKVNRNDVGRTAYQYDALGQLSWQATGNSVSTSNTACDTSVSATDKATFAYDNLGNVKAISFGDSSPDQTYVYDKNSRLAMLTAGNVVTAYEYNSENMIEKETLSLDGESFVLDYIYNSTGNLTNTIYPSGTNIGYAPNALGQAKQVGSYATNALYHANGMVKSHSYGNGFAHTSTQKTSGLPNTFYDKRSSTYALNHGFTYDANNNVTFLDDKVNNAYDLRLTFDGLDRLNNITDSYLGTGDVNYDTLGNITYYKLGNQTIHYYYNSNKQLDYITGSKSYSFTYDDKGNVTDNGTRTFAYNTANQMVQSDGYLYTYDGNNKRVKEHGSNGLSYSFYASNGKLMYRKANNQHIDYYYLGGKLVANKKASTVTYLHSDYLGSTAAESNSAGTVTDRMHYQPFGESIETPKDDVGYTGHKFDTDLGLSYMQARYYDPVIGRFYSNDPVGVRDVHSFNRYAYANNNPYRYIDPFGMSVDDPFSPPEKKDCGCSLPKIPNMFKDSEESDDSGSEDGGDPEIKRQKQNEHIEGTPNHKNRSKQAESPEDLPSTWDNPEEADSLTIEAWNRGEIVKGNPNVKILDFGRRVGTKGDKSFGQKAVKVVRDGKGKIHGTPTGTLRQ
ncbi:RHS repeat-associated core domain-containing protein [Paraglaciecola aquimarina]|uniref:RHS repeat-associated core domain-containing protein n=1 Tax=Paraglaciecola aquimarina TaxID=1235557 RepID=A0ABU3SUF3_9ALTE|nr:RHS repeat-associated core domain-containing protein [Paraglaciecola aquimarina]MDU0353646.1 RHS repeat-associated core domain-containing protein [Paraglaciecola aquimarina]